MLSQNEFIRLSLENNLFWLRLIKEHAIFIEANMPANERTIADEADRFKREFEELLGTAIQLANQSISQESLLSGIYRTRFTDEAERLVTQFTEIPINRQLTLAETNIEPQTQYSPVTAEKEKEVHALNQRILSLLAQMQDFQLNLFNNQASCWLKSFMYTAVLNHLIRETEEYMQILVQLQDRVTPEMAFHADDIYFWNHIMADHAKTIRGLLDPSEALLFEEATEYAQIYDTLMEDEIEALPLDEVYENTVTFREYKDALTKGIIECKVRSLMLPLFTDHLLREANYYLRMLRQ